MLTIFCRNRSAALLTLKGLNHDDDLSGRDGEDSGRNNLGLPGMFRRLGD